MPFWKIATVQTTARQRAIISALGFAVPQEWDIGGTGLGGRTKAPHLNDDETISFRGVPQITAINDILKAAKFRWDPLRKCWYTREATAEQIEIGEAMTYCDSRLYRDGDTPGQAARQSGGRPVCAVHVASYEFRE